jgi:hypothetical protein
MLANALSTTWGAVDDNQTHRHFARFQETGAEDALLKLIRNRDSTEYVWTTALCTLCRLYKNSALPEEYADVCPRVLDMLRLNEKWVTDTIVPALQCVLNVPCLSPLS